MHHPFLSSHRHPHCDSNRQHMPKAIPPSSLCGTLNAYRIVPCDHLQSKSELPAPHTTHKQNLSQDSMLSHGLGPPPPKPNFSTYCSGSAPLLSEFCCPCCWKVWAIVRSETLPFPDLLTLGAVDLSEERTLAARRLLRLRSRPLERAPGVPGLGTPLPDVLSRCLGLIMPKN